MSLPQASSLAPARHWDWRALVRAVIRRPPAAATAILVAALLCAAQSFLLWLELPSVELPINGRAAELLFRGAHAAEHDQRSWFRWSDGNTEIRLYPRDAAGAKILSLALGAPPPVLNGTPLQISAGGLLVASWPLDRSRAGTTWCCQHNRRQHPR